MNDEIYYILEWLSDKSHMIDLLMEKDPEFVELCEEYNDCVNALRYWNRSTEPVAEDRVKEYSTLIGKLEEEIIQALEAFNP